VGDDRFAVDDVGISLDLSSRCQFFAEHGFTVVTLPSRR
jgi:hypothetical protein